MSDDVVTNWSDDRIVRAVKRCVNRAAMEASDALRLGHYGSARALLRVLCERTEVRLKAAPISGALQIKSN